MKDAYYFSHDTNARHDPKSSALIHEYGPEGYGVFWMIIEILSEQNGYKLKKFPKLYEGLAAQFSIEVGRLRSIIEALLQAYELLLQDENYIWSESLMRRMQDKENKRNAKIEAGRQGGLKSGITRNSNKSIEAGTKQNEALLEANEPKEIKVKESKVKENIKDSGASPRNFISPTIEEVKAYCQERKNNIDAEKFINFYASKGWMVGKNKMKDWKASVITWEKSSTDKKSPTVANMTNFEQRQHDEEYYDKFFSNMRPK